MKKILITQPLDRAGMDLLQGRADIIVMKDSSEHTLAESIEDADAVILRTNVTLSRGVLENSPRLLVISRTGVGTSNVDVEAAGNMGIIVCNTSGMNTESVAEHAVMLMLSLSKHLVVMDKAVRNGDWMERRNGKLSDLFGKTLGVMGIGNIGSRVAHMCRTAFGMKIIGYDPFITEHAEIETVKSPGELFSMADIVSLHIPETESTRHLVDKEILSCMKTSSFLINTSRGGIVDQNALAEALDIGLIAGAGLDVFENEPPEINDKLMSMSNVILTPHSAALTYESKTRIAAQAAQAVLDVFSGIEPEFICNRSDIHEQRINLIPR